MDIFSRRIAQLRKERGWSRAEVAKRVGISVSYVRHLEVGIREPRAEIIGRLAEAFGVRADYLLGLTDDPYGKVEGLTPELQEIWNTLVARPDLRMLVSTCEPLSREQVETICRLISTIRSGNGCEG